MTSSAHAPLVSRWLSVGIARALASIIEAGRGRALIYGT